MKLNISQEELEALAAKIKLLLLDVDGVLTDGMLYISSSGEEIKAFNTQDGHGIRMLMERDVQVGIITGRTSNAVTIRAQDLGIEILYQGQKNKISALQEIIDNYGLSAQEIAYAGDDLPDLPVMQAVGLSFAVANAHSTVSETAHCQTLCAGGKGAVREICDCILQIQPPVRD